METECSEQDKAFLEEFDKLLIGMERFRASDLHLKPGSPPIYRVHTSPQRLKTENVNPAFIASLAKQIMNKRQMEIFERDGAVDLSHAIHGMGRFRVNIFRQRGSCSLVARLIPTTIPPLEKLLLPPALELLTDYPDGLVLTVGMTGSGKSTTLAALINRINQKHRRHILTIEDPIEFLYTDDRSFINQREIGGDAPDFSVALRAALRQDPDVILVGEIRDYETMETALGASETGHLVFGTLHATNTTQAIQRCLEYFPADRQVGIRQILAVAIRGVIAQRLLPGKQEAHPLVPAVELLLTTNGAIRKFISDGDYPKLRDSLRAMSGEGMQDFNMSLLDLCKRDLVAKQVAVLNSPFPEQLEMNLKGMS